MIPHESMQTLYMNVYAAGFFHRAGKPNHTNIHGGDLFTSYEDALTNAAYDKGYLTTVQVLVPVLRGRRYLTNPPDSKPTPIAYTRAQGTKVKITEAV